MKKELQEKLFNKYPLTFLEKDLSMKHTAMCWGIDTPDSWYKILARLCIIIEKENMKIHNNYYNNCSFLKRIYRKYIKVFLNKYFFNPLILKSFKLKRRDIGIKIWMLLHKFYSEGPRYITASQVKEKYGTLRFYTNGPETKEICDAINRAEYESSKICAQCGSRKNVKHTDGWITYLCDMCINENIVKIVSNKILEDILEDEQKCYDTALKEIGKTL